MIVDISCWMFGRLHQPQPYRNICSAINYDFPVFLLSWVPWGMGVSFFWSDTGMAFWENLRSALELTTPSWDAPLLSHSYAPQLLALKQKSWHRLQLYVSPMRQEGFGDSWCPGNRTAGQHWNLLRSLGCRPQIQGAAGCFMRCSTEPCTPFCKQISIVCNFCSLR